MGYYLKNPMPAPAESRSVGCPSLRAKTRIGAPFGKAILSTKYWDDATGLGNWGMRYYHPDVGRWLSRDPIGDFSFLYLLDATFHNSSLELFEEDVIKEIDLRSRTPSILYQKHKNELERRQTLDQQIKKLVYIYVQNDPIRLFDILGLDPTFYNCSKDQKDKIISALNETCNYVPTDDFQHCCYIDTAIPPKIKGSCDKKDTIEFYCNQTQTGNCGSSTCAYYKAGIIGICPKQWTDPGCGNLKCSILHELTHAAGEEYADPIPYGVTACWKDCR